MAYGRHFEKSKSLYLSNGLINHHELLHDDAHCHLNCRTVEKNEIFKYPRWPTATILKIINHHNSATV